MKLARLAALLGWILLFGLVRLPLEDAVSDRLDQELPSRQAALNLEMREQLGQLGFVAAFGGLRSVLASLFYLDTYTAWSEGNWAEMKTKYDLVTQLQPRETLYWEMGGWQLAYNASADVLSQESLAPPVRRKQWREMVQAGVAMYEEGIRNNPESWRLMTRLGDLLQDRYKLQDHAAAAEWYARAAALPGTPSFYRRFEAYARARVPGQERQAWEMLRDFWLAGGENRKPTLAAQLWNLQLRLGLSESEGALPLEEVFLDLALAQETLSRFRLNLSLEPYRELDHFLAQLEEALGLPPEQRTAALLPEMQERQGRLRESIE
ncbi:MAG: hypothetical protein AAF555_06975 [Verrucomicrobiota bacterium]